MVAGQKRVDPYLILKDASPTSGRDDDSAGGLNARIQLRARATAYTASRHLLQRRAPRGEFTLTVRERSKEAVEAKSK